MNKPVATAERKNSLRQHKEKTLRGPRLSQTASCVQCNEILFGVKKLGSERGVSHDTAPLGQKGIRALLKRSTWLGFELTVFPKVDETLSTEKTKPFLS